MLRRTLRLPQVPMVKAWAVALLVAAHLETARVALLPAALVVLARADRVHRVVQVCLADKPG